VAQLYAASARSAGTAGQRQAARQKKLKKWRRVSNGRQGLCRRRHPLTLRFGTPLVPEGQPEISPAQRAGFTVQNKIRPEGTVEVQRSFPSSLQDVIFSSYSPGTLSPANFHPSLRD